MSRDHDLRADTSKREEGKKEKGPAKLPSWRRMFRWKEEVQRPHEINKLCVFEQYTESPSTWSKLNQRK